MTQPSLRTILPACTSSARTVEVVQRDQLNHRNDCAEHNEARAEHSLAPGRASAQSSDVGIAGEHNKESQASNDPDLAPEGLLSP